jgi:hypothetical protein
MGSNDIAFRSVSSVRYSVSVTRGQDGPRRHGREARDGGDRSGGRQAGAVATVLDSLDEHKVPACSTIGACR